MNNAQQLLSRAMNALTLEGCDWLAEEIRAYLAESTQDSVIADYATSEPVGGSKMELTTEPTQNDEPTKAEAAAYLYDLDAYCDHRPEQDILAKTLPRLTLEKYLKNIRPLYLHPAPRPEFVRLSEEEVNSLTYAPYEPYELICAVENRLVEKNRG